MRAVIFCFSATGNTLRVANEFKKNFVEKGVEVVVRQISNRLENFSVDGFDMVGVAYPIHGFNAPENVVEFARQLPAVEGKKTFILKSSGEVLKLNNISSNKMAKILKKKGYEVTNEYHYAMPYNMIFRHSDNMASLMARTMEKLAVVHSDEIISGKESRLSKVPFGSLIAWLFRIEHKAMPVFGKHFRATDKCVGCGKCKQLCPRGNIDVVGGKVTFGGKCIGCMACAFSCPVDAIHTSIFNGWKVNGKYNFDSTPCLEDGKHKNYCRRSYEKYFAKAEKLWAEWEENRTK